MASSPSAVEEPELFDTLCSCIKHVVSLGANPCHKLLDVLNKLVDQGNTVVIIEHNLDVIKSADFVLTVLPYIVKTGPDS